MQPRKGCAIHKHPKTRCTACPKALKGFKWCVCGRLKAEGTPCMYCANTMLQHAGEDHRAETQWRHSMTRELRAG